MRGLPAALNMQSTCHEWVRAHLHACERVHTHLHACPCKHHALLSRTFCFKCTLHLRQQEQYRVMIGRPTQQSGFTCMPPALLTVAPPPIHLLRPLGALLCSGVTGASAGCLHTGLHTGSVVDRTSNDKGRNCFINGDVALTSQHACRPR